MNLINTFLGIPLGHVMRFIYGLVQNYGLSIILFALIARAILFPVSVIAQKNAVKMARMKPKLDNIKRRYAGDKDRISEEQYAIFKKEKYSPLFGTIPLLLQIPLILGLINVIYNPLQHLLRLPSETISLFALRAEQVLGEPLVSWGWQLQIVDLVQMNPTYFNTLPSVEQIYGLDLSFFTFNLSLFPHITTFNSLILFPVFSGLSALIMCLVQNKVDVLQSRQSVGAKLSMTLIMVAFSTYFAFIVPAGVGLYWIVGNIIATTVMVILNRMYTVVDMGRHTQKATLTKKEKAEKKQQAKDNRKREKADSIRFFNAENTKRLVFYSQSSGFYKYFAGIIEYVTANSDIIIHYVTSDPYDKIFETLNPKIATYYIGDKALIPFMMKMDADIVVMTMPDLGLFHVKRSLVRKDIEYIFLDHGMTSFHLMYRAGALDYFNTIFCYGPNHIEEVRETEKAYGLRKKRLVSTGYCLLDEMLEKVADLDEIKRKRKQILVAPSWQADNLMELCFDEIVEQLAGKEFCLIIRPHPEFIKRFPDMMTSIIQKYENRLDENFIIQTDFSSNETVFHSDLVITDWSSIAQEFSYATKKPSLFINTPMKIMNPEYKRIPCIPLDISLRDEIGISLDTDNLHNLYDTVKQLLSEKDMYHDKIKEILAKNIFNIGHSKQVAGDYLINSVIIRCIAETLECKPSEIKELTVQKKGMTNRSYLFTRGDKRYIMRIPGEGTGRLINRKKEYRVYKKIAHLNISDDVVYINPQNGYKITTFWDKARVCNPFDENDVVACMTKLREFHASGLEVPHNFDIFERIEFYESLWDGPSRYKDYAETKANIMTLKDVLSKYPTPLALTHVDAVPDNFLFIEADGHGTEELRLIDWEYAAMQDPHVDIAMFAVYAMYDRAHVEKLIDAYFLEGCIKQIRHKIYAYIAMTGLLWSNWCEYKGQYNIEFGDYALKQYQFAKEYYQLFRKEQD